MVSFQAKLSVLMYSPTTYSISVNCSTPLVVFLKCCLLLFLKASVYAYTKQESDSVPMKVTLSALPLLL